MIKLERFCECKETHPISNVQIISKHTKGILVGNLEVGDYEDWKTFALEYNTSQIDTITSDGYGRACKYMVIWFLKNKDTVITLYSERDFQSQIKLI